MPSRKWAVALAATAVFAAPSAWAQDAATTDANATEAVADPAPAPPTIEERGELRVDPASISVPDINFVETPAIAATFDKYFFFHRAGTSFEEALADIRECDDFARGASFHVQYVETNYYLYGQYGVGGAIGAGIGAAIGYAIADAIFGSATRRRQRWQNLRTCMGYKEYQRYGLPKETWEAFNFSEGNGAISERRRQVFLQQQARVASGPQPTGRVLEP